MRDEGDEAAAATAQRLLALDPLQEAVHRALMRIQARRGRQDAALRQYQVCVDVLQRELGAEPEAETRELYREILRRRSRRATQAAAPSRPAGPRPAEIWSPLSEAPLVDRAAELETLSGALQAAEAGRGPAVLVLGEAGIGKSRLLAEFTRTATARGHVLAAGRAYVSTQILPFGAWLPVLQTDGLVDDRVALGQLPHGVRADLARLLPTFEEIGRPRPAGPADATRLFEAVAQLLVAWSKKEHFERALEAIGHVPRDAESLAAAIDLRLDLRNSLHAGGDIRGGQEHLAEAERLAATLGDPRRGGLAAAQLAGSLVQFGETEAARAAAERAGEDADHPYSRVDVSRGRGLVALRRGDVEGALLAFEHARRLDQSTGLTLIRPMLLGGLGHAHTLAGRVDEALPLLQEAAKEGEAMGTVIWQSLRVGWLGEACLLSGQLEAAGQAGADALDLARTYRQRGWEAYALKLLGDISARSGEVSAARAHYDQAIALAQEQGMQPLVGHCHAGLGELHDRAGDRRQAEPHLAAAVKIYRALGMTHWLGPAEAALPGQPPA